MQAGGRCCDKGPAGTSRHRRDGAPASRDPEFPVSPQIPLRTGLHTVQLIRITRHTQSSRTLSPWHKRKWTLRCGQLAAGGANETLKLEMAAEGNMRVRTAHRSLAPTAAVHNVGGAGAPPAQDRWGLGGQGCREAPVCTEGQDVSTAASSQRTKTGTLKGPNRFPPGTLRRGSPRRRDPQKTVQPQGPMGSVKKKKKKERDFCPIFQLCASPWPATSAGHGVHQYIGTCVFQQVHGDRGGGRLPAPLASTSITIGPLAEGTPPTPCLLGGPGHKVWVPAGSSRDALPLPLRHGPASLTTAPRKCLPPQARPPVRITCDSSRGTSRETTPKR